MNCKKCGAPLNEGDVFCQNCGTKVEKTQNNIEHHNKQHVNNNGENNKQMNNGPMNNGSMHNNAPMNNGPMYNNAPINYAPMYNNAPMNNGPMYNNSTMNNESMYNIPSMNNGPMYNNQAMNNGNMYGNSNGYYQKPKSGGIGIFAIVGAILVLGIGILVYFLLKPGNESTTPVISQNNSYTVNLGGYTFRVPNEYVSEVDTDGLLLGDSGNTWMGSIQIVDSNYTDVKSKLDEVKANIEASGYIVNEASIKTIAGTEVLAYTVSYAGTVSVVGYAKLDSSHIIACIGANVNNTADYDVLSKTIAVGLTGKPASSRGITIGGNLDLANLFKPAQ